MCLLWSSQRLVSCTKCSINVVKFLGLFQTLSIAHDISEVVVPLLVGTERTCQRLGTDLQLPSPDELSLGTLVSPGIWLAS